MSIFPTKILLATDGSKDATLAARTVVGLCNTTGSELYIVTVGPRVSERDAWGEAAAQALRRGARKLLDVQVRRIEEAKGSVKGTYPRFGRTDGEIVAVAEEIGAGLIVVGSRGRGGIRRALMGSVSDSVIRHAHCPVLVVRGGRDSEPPPFLQRVLLATDGSEEAELALKTTLDLTDKSGSELHVVHVGRLLSHSGGVAVARGPLPGEQDALDREARRLLESQVKKIETAGGIVVHAHLRSSERPDAEIVSVADEVEAGLIVMGSRGLGGMRRLLIGSVCDSVVRHAHCPVMVVREESPQVPAGARQMATEQQ